MGSFSQSPAGAQPTRKTVGSANRALLATDLNIIKPQYYDKFVDKYGSQNYMMFLEYIGNKAVIPSRIFRHFESKGKLHAAVQAGTNTGSPFTIAATGTAITLAASQSPVRVGEVVESTITGRQYKVSVVTSATNITLIPLQTGTNQIAENEWLLMRGAKEVGEASTSLSAINNDIVEISNTTTEIREDFSITDRAKIEEIWFEVNGQAYYTYKGLDETVRRFNNNKEFQLVFGKPASNSANLGVASVGSQGLVDRVESSTNGGSVYATATQGKLTTAEFFDLARQIDFFGGGSNYHFLMDSFLRQGVDEELFTKYSSGGVLWGQAGAIDSELAVKFGFDSFKVGGVNFNLKKYLPFNSESVYGISQGTGSKYQGYGILIPMKEGRDAVSGDKVPSMRVVYNEVEGGKEIKVWETGALAQVPTSDKMELNVHHMAYCGLQVFAANQFIVVKKP